MTLQLDQGSRHLTQLEEEKKNTEQNLKRTQGLFDDLKGKIVQPNKSDLVKYVFLFFIELLFSISEAKSEGQTEELKRIQSKFEHQSQMSAQDLSNMKKTLCDAETKNER